MDQITLGRTGLRVSRVGMGTGGHSQLGRKGGGTNENAVAIVKAALDRGVTFIDTAASYGTEPIVREALQGRRDVVISTKVKITVSDKAGATGPLIDGPELKRRAEKCLSLLGRDCVDILHLHGVRPDEYGHSVRELVPALYDLRQAGKIRFLGLTEKFDEDTSHVMLDRALNDDHWDVVMTGINIVNQTALRRALPAMRARNLGMMCMYAVRSGLVDRASSAILAQQLIAGGEVDAARIDAQDPLGFAVTGSGARSLTEAAYRFSQIGRAHV